MVINLFSRDVQYTLLNGYQLVLLLSKLSAHFGDDIWWRFVCESFANQAELEAVDVLLKLLALLAQPGLKK